MNVEYEQLRTSLKNYFPKITENWISRFDRQFNSTYLTEEKLKEYVELVNFGWSMGAVDVLNNASMPEKQPSKRRWSF